jgi:hypothetical protein
MLSARTLQSARTLLYRSRLTTIRPVHIFKTPSFAFSSTPNFLSGNNASYIEKMHEQWKRDPKSVDASWQAYFATDDFQAPPTLGMSRIEMELQEIKQLIKQTGGPRAS